MLLSAPSEILTGAQVQVMLVKPGSLPGLCVFPNPGAALPSLVHGAPGCSQEAHSTAMARSTGQGHLSNYSAYSCPCPCQGLNWISQFVWSGSNAAQFNPITLHRKRKYGHYSDRASVRNAGFWPATCQQVAKL